jgi:hypothetical protein
MARIRTIKHEFFYSEQVTSVSAFARLFFIGLWTVADRDGRMQWAPRKLKAQIFPYDDVEVYKLAEELTAAGLMHIYEIDGQAYAWIPGFAKHQRPHPKEPESTVPACPNGHKTEDIPWKRGIEPLKETASREKPGSIPSSPARNGSMDYGSMDKGNGDGERRPSPSSAPLVMSPLEFAKAQERCAYVGARLQVPRKLHGDFRRALGGTDPDARLQTWYAEVDEEIERTGESIVPDVFKWLEQRFKPWATDRAVSDELERFRPKGA